MWLCFSVRDVGFGTRVRRNDDRHAAEEAARQRRILSSRRRLETLRPVGPAYLHRRLETVDVQVFQKSARSLVHRYFATSLKNRLVSLVLRPQIGKEEGSNEGRAGRSGN